jgi:type I restriction enzyme R subunit
MQQAIEENFILDVLQNYTPYKLAFKLAHDGQEYDSDAPLVDQAEAVKNLMSWLRLHPTNIDAKVSIIVEHFRSNVSKLLNGKAKAMVVTSSRKEAVRYKLAFDEYVKDKNYKDVQALVAFSGEVIDTESGPDTFNESNMNPGLKRRSLPEAFNSDDYQVMLVANKFQTGFDQPLLCAMYVDKRLSGVSAVQTLSRLNRVATGKDTTFILDFVNDPEEIRQSFLPYFKTAELTEIADQNIISDLERKLDSSGIYDSDDVKQVSDLVINAQQKKGNNALTAALAKPKDLFRSKLKQARESGDGAEVDRLEDFRKTVDSFVKSYSFLSQVYDYGDTQLERLFIFLKQLSNVIAEDAPESFIDLSEVELLRYQIVEQKKTSLLLDETGELKPISGIGTHEPGDPKMVLLNEAIEKVNQLVDFTDGSESSGRVIVDAVNLKLRENETIVAQAKANGEDQFLGSSELQDAVVRALISVKNDTEDASGQILESDEKIAEFKRVVGRAVFAMVNDIAS